MTSNIPHIDEVRRLVNAVRHIRELHLRTNNLLRDIDGVFESLADPQKVDVLWCVRELERNYDELRKEAKARTVRHGEKLATNWIREAMESDDYEEDEEKKVRGFIASGSPTGRLSASTVRPGQDGYKELCESFGVPEELAASGTFVFKYDGLAELLTALTESGVDVSRLPGIKKTYTQFSMSITTLRNGTLESYTDE